jgi:hypothetical protein
LELVAVKDIKFILKCALFAGLIMFVCMAAGELLVDPLLFRGFLSRPRIWPMIFIESATWMIPLLLLFMPVLKKTKKMNPMKARSLIAGGWIAVGTLIVGAYKALYYPNHWELQRIARADITFGWTLPCAIILAGLIVFSLQHLRTTTEN